MTRRARLPLIAAVLALALIGSGCAAIQELAELPQLHAADLKPKLTPQTSVILDARGKVITTFHGAENRTVVSLDQMQNHTLDAVVAIEDERFFEHDGIDMRGIARAAVENVKSGDIEQGGSTITQQFVKNRIIAPGEDTADRTLHRKVREAALARQVEEELSKEAILERYLNTIYFGNGAYGVQAAAKTYFGKDASELWIHQSALLAGLIRAPQRYDPFDHAKRAKKRRDVVLEKMEEQGLIGSKRAERARSFGLGLSEDRRGKRYFAPYFVDYVKRLLVFHPRFDLLGDTPAERSERLYTGGLRIHTTLVRKQQKAAERAIERVLTEGRDPHASLVAIDPRNGYVKAVVGGRNFFEGKGDREFSKLNLAIAARADLGRSSGRSAAAGSGRQAGSAFKPFALAAALDGGVPLSRRYMAPACHVFPKANDGKPWKVCNYAGASYGRVGLREATYKSINVAYAKLVLDIGPKPVTKMARKLGIRTPLAPVNSGALGTNPVNPLGMASAYSTLANNGKRAQPVAITKIVDHTGERIYRAERKQKRTVDAAVAYSVNNVLKDVIKKGTGTRAQIGRPAAGKTGTAQEYRDAWFVGSVPQLTAAVWVGYPEGSIEMKTSCGSKPRNECRPTRIQVSGGTWPAEIWRNFMTSVLERYPVKHFKKPRRGLETVTIDVRNGCPATSDTPKRHKKRVRRVESTAPSKARCRRIEDRLYDDETDEVNTEDDGTGGGNIRDREAKASEDESRPSPSPTPEQEPDPIPDPDPEPTPDPDPEPKPDPDPEPTPDPDPTPTPTPDPTPEDDPSGDPEPTSAEEPVGEATSGGGGS